MPDKLYYIVLLLLFSITLKGQVAQPSASFNRDSIKLGEEVAYSLSIRYLKTRDVVFPDSLYNFAPFELNRKISFPTKSDSLFSLDSAVYFLTTFELDTVQRLNLPIFMVTDGDSLKVFGGDDSIILHHVVLTIPDSIVLIANTSYSNVNLNFNYPYLIVGVTVAILITLILFFTFGKNVKKRYLIYKLNRLHRKFVDKFNIEIHTAEQSVGSKIKPIEHLIDDWKLYMENLNKQPYTKLTTREIQLIYQDNHLNKALVCIDRAIYGGLTDKKLVDSFYYLRNASEDSFRSKMREVQNG